MTPIKAVATVYEKNKAAFTASVKTPFFFSGTVAELDAYMTRIPAYLRKRR